MNKEDLVKLGLTEEQAKAVKNLWKEELDGKYVPKETFDAERQKVKDKDSAIAERDSQLKELGKFKGNAEELQKKVDELTEKNATATKEYEEKLSALEKDSAIRLAVGDSVYNFDDVKSRLDFNKIFIKDGKVESGLKEQIDSIQKNYPHYFKPAEGAKNGLPTGWQITGKTPSEGGKGGEGEDPSVAMAKMFAQSAKTDENMKKAEEYYFGPD